MQPKTKWIILAVGSFLAAAGSSFLIYHQNQVLTENRAQVSTLRGEIDAGRALVSTTRDLEDEVIVQRETDEVIKEILSEDEDLNAFTRRINEFVQTSGVEFQGLSKEKRPQVAGRNRGRKESFERVGYNIKLEADAFAFLSFLDAVETHARFISVTQFNLTAVSLAQLDRGAEPTHQISVDLETYVYRPTEGTEEARIDNYDRKRDMLMAEIQQRSDDLRIPTYNYRGSRGRRDPWIDPRIPVNGPEPVLSIEEQTLIVERLEEQAKELDGLWEAVKLAQNVIAEIKARATLEEALVRIEEELRREEQADRLSFLPAQRRFENNVVAVVDDIRQLSSGEGSMVPSLKELEEVAGAVRRHLEQEEYTLALQSYQAIAPRLATIVSDERKLQIADDLSYLADQAQKVLDFSEIDMNIGGVALMEGVRPVALINGESIAAGEYLDYTGELFVSEIRSHEIEFVYQGVTLIRRLDGTHNENP